MTAERKPQLEQDLGYLVMEDVFEECKSKTYKLVAYHAGKINKN